MKKGKTTKRLATLSAAFLVGSVATFGADVRANDVKNDAASTKSSPKREEYRRYSTSLLNPADFDLADEHPS